MKLMHSSTILAALGLLVLIGSGNLQGATIQTTKGARISTLSKSTQTAATPGNSRMTEANCPHTVKKTARITSAKYSKAHDQVTRTGVVERMQACHQELSRQPDKQTTMHMVGCDR